MPDTKIKVLVQQNINRAYRAPLLKKLSGEPDIELTMIHGTDDPVIAGDIGISLCNETLPFRTIGAHIGGIRTKEREFLWFGEAIRLLRREEFDVVITDFYTRLLSIWPMQSIQRRRRAGFMLWGIGFNQYPTPLLDRLRMFMVKRTDALLLYSEKEKQRYVDMGTSPEKCFVTQNTVDIEGIEQGIALASREQVRKCREKVGVRNHPLLLHVGRLAPNKRLDLLIRVLPGIRRQWENSQLVLIGEGPELQGLKQIARESGVSNAVHFPGPIIDHKELAPWMLAGDIVVAPGQIGLLAPMTLVYGKPIVTSDRKELHGPEVQVIVPGKTGVQYKYEDLDNLSETISRLLGDREMCKNLTEKGSEYVREIMGPDCMMDSFLQAIHYVYYKNNDNRE